MISLPYDLKTVSRTQIGLIVLQTDETIERDMRRLLPSDMELLVSRVPSGTHVTLESLAAMETDLERAASLLPRGVDFSAVGYGCTSAAAQIGPDRVAQVIKAGVTTSQVTEPISAVVASCQELGIGRIGLLSPYIESVSDRLCDRLAESGIETCAFASFNESEDWRVARISPASIASAAKELAASAAMDALFISCTNLQTLDIISQLEIDLGLPVLTSNKALAFDLIRLSTRDS